MKNKLHTTIAANPSKLAFQQLFLDNFDIFLSSAQSQYVEYSSSARFENKHQTYRKCEIYSANSGISETSTMGFLQLPFNFPLSQLQFVFGSNLLNKLERRKEL